MPTQSQMKPIFVMLALLAAVALVVAGCGGGGGSAPVDDVSITISPDRIALSPGGTAPFTATVSGTSNTAVTWSATGGSLTVNGNIADYTAPYTEGTYIVTATSVADPSKSASAEVLVSVDLPPPPPPW